MASPSSLIIPDISLKMKTLKIIQVRFFLSL